MYTNTLDYIIHNILSYFIPIISLALKTILLKKAGKDSCLFC